MKKVKGAVLGKVWKANGDAIPHFLNQVLTHSKKGCSVEARRALQGYTTVSKRVSRFVRAHIGRVSSRQTSSSGQATELSEHPDLGVGTPRRTCHRKPNHGHGGSSTQRRIFDFRATIHRCRIH